MPTATAGDGGSREAIFLATTALEEFWDPTRRLLFAGEWCRRADRAAAWRHRSAEVVPDPWDEPAARREAEAYCSARVTALLQALKGFLNTHHQERHGDRYWRILLGPWLLHFTQAFYDRFRILERAFSRHPDLDTRVLAPGSYITPRDWADYTYLVFGDGYNLQLFSQLLATSGRCFPAATHRVRPDRLDRRGPGARLRAVARLAYGRGLEVVGARRPILLHGSRLRRGDLWRLVLATRLRVWPFEPPLEARQAPPDPDARRALADLDVEGADRFTARLVRALPVNLPVVYLEGYRRLREETAAVRRGRPRVVVSGLGWKSNERFKCVAADAAERGARLIGLQHGGSSWVMAHSPMDRHIATVADEYWSWGRRRARLVPTPDPLLGRALARPGQRATTGGAMFVGTMFARFVTSFRSQPIGAQVLAYIRDQCAFFSALSAAERDRFLVRLYPHELGWCNRERLRESAPDLRFDDFSTSFDDRLREVALVVVDNLQTTFVEALCANRPVVLFYNPRYWAMSASAGPALDRLGEACILHPTPDAAARHVSGILAAPADWWEQPAVQRARETFLDWCVDRRSWLPVWRSQLLAAAEGPLVTTTSA